MIYLDTSVLIAVHTREPGSRSAIDWLEQIPAQHFALSLWTVTEFASALARKVRMQRMTLEEKAQTAAEFKVFCEGLTVFAPEPQDYRRAVEMMSDPQTGLRAGDALHLAMAARTHSTLATFDALLQRSASAFNVESVRI